MKTKKILIGLLSAAAVCGSLAAPVNAKNDMREMVCRAKLFFNTKNEDTAMNNETFARGGDVGSSKDPKNGKYNDGGAKYGN